jgi:hypothetical protein
MVEDSTTAFVVLGKDYLTKAMRPFFQGGGITKSSCSKNLFCPLGVLGAWGYCYGKWLGQSQLTVQY